MKAIKFIFKCILIIAMILCLGIEAYIHGAFDFLEKLDQVSSSSELTEYLQKQLEEGKDSADVYVTNLSESKLKGINRQLDGFFGTVKSYTLRGKNWKGVSKLHVSLEVSDNYLVYQALVKGTSTQNDMTEKEKQLYQTAKQILDQEITTDMSDFQKEKAIHDYLVKNCVFAKEYENEDRNKNRDVYSAYGALVNHQAVCNGYSEAIKLLLNACDIPCQMVVGTASGSSHAWDMVCLGDEWYHLDATWDDPVPDQKKVVQYQYFNLNDEQIAQTHQWNKSNYPACNADTYNYYQYYGKVCRDYSEFVSQVNQQIAKKKKKITLLIMDYDKKTYDMSFIMDQHLNVSAANYSLDETRSDGAIITLEIMY